MTNDALFPRSIKLRKVKASDLPIFFKQQMDPDATHMADFPSHEREEFMIHWAKILHNDDNVIRTILNNNQVAGNIVSFIKDEKREVGYWLGKEYWDRGIATTAMKLFLKLIKIRPIYAYVVEDNYGSRRVLEKCGFVISNQAREFSNLRGVELVGFLYKLG